jgi:MFS superfamily sulfate permease-like transporter
MKKRAYLWIGICLVMALAACDNAKRSSSANAAQTTVEQGSTVDAIESNETILAKTTETIVPADSALESAPQETAAEVVEGREAPVEEVVAPVTSEDVRQQTALALETTRRFVKQKEQFYYGKIDEQLKSFNERLDVLRERAGLISEQAKKRVTSELDSLAVRVDDTSQKLVELNSSSNQALGELSKELEEMLSAVARSLDGGMPVPTEVQEQSVS